MKTPALLGFLILILTNSCDEKNILWNSEKTNEIDISGSYRGSFFICGKQECTTTDTGFRILKSANKYILQFGNIEEPIEFVNNSKVLRSSEIFWDSTGTSGTYGITGRMQNDSLFFCIGSKFIAPDIYQNMLSGHK